MIDGSCVGIKHNNYLFKYWTIQIYYNELANNKRVTK